MIGKLCTSKFPYYNTSYNKMCFKNRPVLVIGKADSSDYNVLPISTISHRENIHRDYDIMLSPNDYPALNLKKISYVRVHKQSVVNYASLAFVSDLKLNYPELFKEIMDRLERYNKELIDFAKGNNIDV